jgi:hypothetical protein
MLGGHNPDASLLPVVPAHSAPIVPVQGGGGAQDTPTKGWYSMPLKIKGTREYKPTTNHTALKKFQSRWKQTLGPNIPSRRRARNVSADEHIIVGSLNIIECPTFVVAPLRGDINAAKDILHWAESILRERPDVHIVFNGPITEGGNSEDAMMIEKM